MSHARRYSYSRVRCVLGDVCVSPAVVVMEDDGCAMCGRVQTKGNQVRSPRAATYGNLYLPLRHLFQQLRAACVESRAGHRVSV